MFNKITMMIAFLFVLSACGGGGDSSPPASQPPTSTPGSGSSSGDDSDDGSSSTPPSTLKISSGTRVLSVDENSNHTLNFSVDYTGDDTLIYSTNASSSVLSASVSGERVQVTVGDITEYQAQGSISITVTDGVLQDILTLDISVTNRSLLNDLDDVSAEMNDVITYYEQDISLQNVLTYYMEIAALIGEIPANEAQEELALLSGQAADNKADNELAVITIYNALSDASNGQTITEEDLTAWQSEFDSVNDNYAQLANQLVSQARSATGNTVPEITIDMLHAGDVVSLFVGNTTVGKFNENGFAFSTTYTYLNELVDNKPAVCTTFIGADA